MHLQSACPDVMLAIKVSNVAIFDMAAGQFREMASFENTTRCGNAQSVDMQACS